jgi:hypothetical protein
MMREIITFFAGLLVIAVILVGTAMLVGCSELKYAECIARDRTSNPCN